MNRFIELLKKRFAARDEQGFSLLEIVISVVIFGLLTTLVFNLFQTSRETTANVQDGSTSIAQAQTATSQLAKKVRNASKVKVSSDGSRLDIENSDGTCTAWVYYDKKLYYHDGGEAQEFSTSWLERLPEASLTASGRFFSEITDGISYSFNSGSGVGTKKIEGESYMRVPSNSDTSTCFGDAPDPVEETPEPTPTTPPVTVYTISYELAGGVSSTNPSHYTKDSTAFTLVNPTREGYNFSGWTGTDISGTSSSVSIPQGSTGNRSYTATWTAIPVTPTPTPTPTPTTPSAGMTASIRTVEPGNQWYKVAKYAVTIKNTGTTAVNGWKISFDAPGASGISGWGGSCSISGGKATCVNEGYNANIAPGGTLTFEGQLQGVEQIASSTTVTAGPR